MRPTTEPTPVNTTAPESLVALLKRLAPLIVGLALTQFVGIASVHLTHADLDSIWLNDLAGLIALAALAVPTLLVFIRRLRLPPHVMPLVAYGAASLGLVVFILISAQNLLDLGSTASEVLLFGLAFLAQTAGTFYWLQASRGHSTAQTVIIVCSATMLYDILVMGVLGLFGATSFLVCLLFAVGSFFCVAAHRRRQAGWSGSGVCTVPPGPAPPDPTAAVTGTAAPEEPGLISLAAQRVAHRRLVATVALGIALLAFGTGLFLAFGPADYLASFYYLSVLAHVLIVQSTGVFFIHQAYRSQFWHLSLRMLGIITVLLFASLIFGLLFVGGPLATGTILGNSINTMLVTFAWYFVIFLMTRGARDPVAYHLFGLYFFLLPQILGRSVVFPLLNASENIGVFAAALAALGLIPVALMLSLFLRALLLDRAARVQRLDQGLSLKAMADQMGTSAPGGYTDLRAESMRLSIDDLAQRFGLSQREAEVLTLYALGHTQKNVAQQLCISFETVHTHIKNCYVKTGLGSRQELIDYLSKN
jgi:DNA-binding CsgD family transcriptional regulator